tara:strand:+ start:359 stop:577 length:219 start_codon:yes stop_codon:yes gene_type:complete
MDLVKKKRLMLTTSASGDIIVAEVKQTHQRNRGEYFVSEDFVRINCENGQLTDITGKLDYSGRIYILSDDMG